MVTFDLEQIDRAVRDLQHIPGAAQKALARAMNRAIDGARTTAVKLVRATYRVSAADVKATIGKPSYATPAKLQAGFTSKGKRVPLYAFGPKPSEPGTGGRGKPYLRVAVKRGRPKSKIKRAFIARVRGRLQIMIRKTKARKPIKPLFGPAIPQMMGVEDTIAEVERIAKQRLDARLDHEIQALLDGFGRSSRRSKR